MAIYRSAIFNELRKKLANTVMYKLESQGIMRSAPGKIKNPRTPEQLTQRAKISLLGDLGRRFAPIIKEGFRERPKMNSVFNAFVSANVPFVTVDDEYQASVDFTEILCSNGGLDLPDVTAAFTDNTITVAQTAQDNTGTGVKGSRPGYRFLLTGLILPLIRRIRHRLHRLSLRYLYCLVPFGQQ